MREEQRLFCDGDLATTLVGYYAKAVAKVDSIPEGQFLHTDDDTLVDHIVSESEVLTIELHEDQMVMEQGETKIDVTGRFEYATFPGERTLVPGLKVTVTVPYTGDPMLWRLTPSQYHVSSFPRAVVQQPKQDGIGYIQIVLQSTSETTPEVYKQDFDRTMSDIHSFLENQKRDLAQKAQELPPKVRQAVQKRRERLQKHKGVIDAINIPLKKKAGVPDTAAIPVRRKLVRPLPSAPDSPPEPGIREEDYEHILTIIRHEGRSFEATPGTFAVHDEEELRDIILAHLNGHYEGDATGERFRCNGKTDICIEDKERAAFVGECKVWHGPKELGEAVDQLLGYLTWRDCKAALVVFNKHVAGFAEIQGKLPGVLETHAKFLRSIDSTHAGEWRFVFRSGTDPDRHIMIHVFLFNLYVNGEA